ncbi:MAG: hypothetical protein ACPG49_13950 [Chitinophagales bacterium]
MKTTTKHFFTITLILSLWSCTNQNQSKPKTDNTKTITIVEEKKTPVEKTKEEAKPVEIQAFEYSEWTDGAKSGDGCSCAFRTEKDNYKAGDVFASNIEKDACIKLDGKMIALQGGRTDNSDELYKNSFESPWIVLNEKGDNTLFGEKIDFEGAWRKNIKRTLKQTLHLMDELPEEISMKSNGTVGMGTRGDFRDICSESLKEVKFEKKNGKRVVIFETLYQNETYDCVISAHEIGKNDSGGSKYEGTMLIKSKDGKVLGTKPVWGECGC